MKTQYQFIHFVNEPPWTCLTNRNNDLLGVCEFYQKWSKWEFCPADNTGFSTDCLRDIAHFLDQLKHEK